MPPVPVDDRHDSAASSPSDGHNSDRTDLPANAGLTRAIFTNPDKNGIALTIDSHSGGHAHQPPAGVTMDSLGRGIDKNGCPGVRHPAMN